MKSRTDLSSFCMHCLVHSGPAFFTLSFNVYISLLSLLLRNSNISAPFLLFVTFPYCPMFSFGLLAFPIPEFKSSTMTTSPCLLLFCRSTAIFPNFFCISLAVLLDSGGVYMFPEKKCFAPLSPLPSYP